MWMLIASSFVIGLLLATKFRVFVLLPMIILGAAVILLANMLSPISEISTEIVAYAVALQVGYLVGAGTYHALLGDHTTRRQSNLSLSPPTH
jgi:hypothetical protein